MIHDRLASQEAVVQQLDLVRPNAAQPMTMPPAKLDDKTLREVIALMAEAILAVLRRSRREGAADER